MWVCTRVFHVPKRGNADAEYEDAFYPECNLTRQLGEFRCAVADGASESAFSGLWARLLVRSFGRRRMHLQRLRKLWQRAVGTQPVPWYLERKLKSGAHAAFMGLRIREGRWRALAVGDSCLFQVRDDELITVGPLSRSDQFDNSPFLLGSKSAQSIGRNAPHVSVHAGTWSRNDRFYLATDAMAQWLLLRDEAGLPPWTMLRELGEQDTLPFDELVTEMRLEHDLHNDDTTLLRVEVS